NTSLFGNSLQSFGERRFVVKIVESLMNGPKTFDRIRNQRVSFRFVKEPQHSQLFKKLLRGAVALYIAFRQVLRMPIDQIRTYRRGELAHVRLTQVQRVQSSRLRSRGVAINSVNSAEQ